MRISSKTEEHRILVVEDDECLRLLITKILERDGFATVSARNGKEAIEKGSAEPFDAIVLDLAMPEMDGFTFLACREGRLKAVPVLVLTAHHERRDVARAVELGAKDFMTKPFEAPTLLRRVHRLIKPVQLRPGHTAVAWDQPSPRR